jgi:hypothetical protein
MLNACPVCGHLTRRRLVARRQELTVENRLRDDWVLARVRHLAHGPELKDLTDFMHADTADLFACFGCGTVLRQAEGLKAASDYRADVNDSGVMQQVYPRYVRAFSKKETGYRDLLRPMADIVEIGSHLGAFLEVAEGWEWRPIGLDVGVDTVPFARRLGLTVRHTTAEDAQLRPGAYDAVFIWNCLEQLADPKPALAAARAWLKRHGVLVVRVPNVEFYLRHRAQPDLQPLAYNNLLGFPYLYGYTPRSLQRLLSACGFELIRAFNSELITSPFPDLTDELRAEQCQVSREVALESGDQTISTRTLSGPWIEMAFRRLEEPSGRVSSICSALDFRFLQRAA